MKILRINMQNRSSRNETLRPDQTLVGGRALIGRMLNNEIPTKGDPLSSDNKLMFCCGALAGSGITSAGRLSVGARSPLTGGAKESNAGGEAGDALARLGLRAVILEDLPEDNTKQLLFIDEDSIEFKDAASYTGMGNFEAAEKLFEEFGKDYVLILCGPAGEKGLFASGIAVTDMYNRPGRMAARGGLGAVMGSKGIKAILIKKSGNCHPEGYGSELFKKLRKEFNVIIRDSERVSVLREYGTASTVMQVETLGALPTRNFSKGSFEHAEAISGESLHSLINDRGGCGTNSEACMRGCQVKCSNVLPDSEGKEIVAPLEYETLGMLGSNIEIGSLDQIGELNRICNDLGVDTIEMGGSLGVIAEAGKLEFGDYEGFKKLLNGIFTGDELSLLAGMGAARCGEALGVTRIPTVKKQTMSAYDPRGVKGTGITYATTPMGADHTAGLTVFFPVDHHEKEGQFDISRKMQLQRTMYDCIGLCSFLTSAIGRTPEIVTTLYNALHNTEISPEDWEHIALTTLDQEIAFNRDAGLGKETDRIPDFFMEEKLPPYNLEWNITDDELDSVVSSFTQKQ